MPTRFDSRGKELLAVTSDPAMDATDRATVAETSIEEREVAIDDAVYDLFELSDEEREVVEEYLEVF